MNAIYLYVLRGIPFIVVPDIRQAQHTYSYARHQPRYVEREERTKRRKTKTKERKKRKRKKGKKGQKQKQISSGTNTYPEK